MDPPRRRLPPRRARDDARSLGVRRIPAPAPSRSQPTSFRQLTFLAGGESSPALAPDGESFAYVKEIDGQKDVFLQRVGGSKPVNLTAECAEDDDEPAFSPDGKRIAYRSECAGGGIFVMGATGESARKVTDSGYNPSWSPDGLELAVADEQLQSPFGRGTTSKVWAVRVETGERRLLAGRDGIQPSWSPDGRRVAFWGIDEGTSARDLFTVAADGSQSAESAAVRVLDDPPVDWSPVWSADGRSLLFSSTRGGTMNLWRIGVDPSTGRPLGAPRPVTVPSSWAGKPSVSADGHRIAFVDRNVRTSIRLAPSTRPPAQSPGRPAPRPSARSRSTTPSRSRPTAARSSSTTPAFRSTSTSSTPAAALRQLTEGPHRDRQGAFSPDGEWIAFQTDRWPTKLGVIRPDGSGLRALTDETKASAFYPSWSPDGQLARLRGDGRRLPGRGGRRKGDRARAALRTPPGRGSRFWPWSVSPDGRKVAGSLTSSANSPVGSAIYGFPDRSYREVAADRATQLLFLPTERGSSR